MGKTEEINDLALLLQEQLRRAGMSVRELCEAFNESHFRDGTPIPSRATVYRRLKGQDLLNQGPLIEAIITICVPPADVEEVRTRAADLRRKAALPSARVAATAGSEPGTNNLHVEIGRLRQQLISAQNELLTERGRHADMERQRVDFAAILMLLMSLHARTRTDVVASSSAPKAADLERDLRRTQKERDAAKSELALAQHRIRDLESDRAVEVAMHPANSQQSEPDSEISVFAPDLTFIDLEALKHRLDNLDPAGSRMAAALRRALDVTLDGTHTGRFLWDQLSRTERTTLGTRIEIELGREFGFESGALLDFSLEGIEFDCMYSMKPGGWIISREAVGRICLLITADDQKSTWSAGLIHVVPELLTHGSNRDGRAALNAEGRSAIHWLHRDATLPNNVLVHLPQPDIDAIFAPRTAGARVVELLRRAQRQPISRTAAATVALQEDSERRIREARPLLAEEGIVLLNGSKRGRQAARTLHLPVPTKNEWVTARVTPWEDHHENRPFTNSGGQRWVLAEPCDPVVPAPNLLR